MNPRSESSGEFERQSASVSIPEIFGVAAELPPESRAAYLDRVCAGDAAVRAEIESLLRAHASGADQFLRRPLQMASTGEIPDGFATSAAPGSRLGSYKIIQPLAAGGMGAVYLAERVDEAFEKQVAIKVIHPSLWGSEAVLRFRQERQLLADLEHPGIARLIDGGAMPPDASNITGQLPYFVMEYVDGVPINRYCDEHRLDVPQRLALFLEVCDIVLYAHQNLVIHRDLKPSNILVDRSGRVKLLDFGIAKILGGAAESQEMTGTYLPLTPRYASPEHVLGRRMTTATDIYSLGVVLYELLTGGFPYDLDSQSPTEIARTITNELPLRPSRRVPADLSSRLAGDLDMIVLKALHKDPAQRYATAEDFASDVRRHLARLPVLARPDTVRYRVTKFVSRNRALVAGATAVIIVVVAAFATTFIAYRQTSSAHRESEWQAYVGSLAAAEASIRHDQMEEAADYLEGAPPALRSWEWRHLKSRLDRSVGSFRAHRKGITQIAFLPDGEHFVTSAVDSMIRIWKAGSDTLVEEFGPFDSEVESLAPVFGTNLIAIGLNNGRVLIIDRATRSTRELLPSGPSWAFVSASADGSRLACGFFDGRVRVWSIASGELLEDWHEHVGLAYPVYSPDGQFLATGGGDGLVKLYDAQSLVHLHTFNEHQLRVYRIAFSADGATLAASSIDRTVSVWDVRGRELICTFREHHATVGAIAFDPKGCIVTGAGDNRFLRWTPAGGNILGQFRGHIRDVSALAAHPDGSRLVSGDWEGTIKTWEWGTEDVRTFRVTSGWLVPAMFDAAWACGETAIVCATNAGDLAMWKADDSKTPVASFAAVAPVRCVECDQDGNYFAAGNDAGELVLFQARDAVAVCRIKAHRGPVLGLAINAHGDVLASASADSTVRIWSLPSMAPVDSLTGHGGAVRDVAFGPRGDYLASCGADGTIRLWDVHTWQALGVLRETGSDVYDIAFDPTGTKMAIAADTASVKIWDLKAMRPVLSIPSHGRTRALAWSSDGTRIVTGGSDAIIGIYGAVSGRKIASLHGHVASITSLQFSRNDEFLTSTSLDGTAKVWDAMAVKSQRLVTAKSR